jgi:hypothetical protein
MINGYGRCCATSSRHPPHLVDNHILPQDISNGNILHQNIFHKNSIHFLLILHKSARMATANQVLRQNTAFFAIFEAKFGLVSKNAV